MGGTLTIKSKPGIGSVFTVEIPFPNASEEQREVVLHPVTDVNAEKPFYTRVLKKSNS